MDNRYRFVVGFLVVLNALLTALLCGLVRDTRQDLNALRAGLATKQDLVNLAAPRLVLSHEEKCTSCHTERRFAGAHAAESDIERAIARMKGMPGAQFSPAELAKVHASLELLRCAQCHGADKLRALAIKSPAERRQIVSEMIGKPRSRINPDEAAAILRAYEQLTGY